MWAILHLYLLSAAHQSVMAPCLLAAQGVDNSVLRCASKLAGELGQNRSMVRLALLPDTAASAPPGTATAAADADVSSNSQGSLSMQLLRCYLLPPRLPTFRHIYGLSRQLNKAVNNAAKSKGSTRQQYAAEVQSLVDMFRLCNFKEQQPHWRQQRRLPGELCLKDLSVTKLSKDNQPEPVIAQSVKLLEEVGTMRHALLDYECVGSLAKL
jgi:hypothetical protein